MQTGSSNQTYYYDELGNQYFPCRCGKIHKGDYGFYDYMHHNCYHKSALIPIDAETGFYLCGECGETFRLKFEGSDCPQCGEEWRAASGYEQGDTIQVFSCSKGHEWEGPTKPFRV